MWVLVIMYLLLIPGVAFFVLAKHKFGVDNPKTVAIKAACTVIAVLAAIVGTAQSPDHAHIYAIFIAAGLVLGLVGDVVICQKSTMSFLFGMVYFAIGHLCYIVAFTRISRHILWSIPAFIIIFLSIVFIARKIHLQLGKMLIPTIVYCLIITIMVSFAITIPFSNKYGYLIFSGAILFAISDAMLAYGVYKSAQGLKRDMFGLYCYYIGQSLFAVSTYFQY